MRPTAPDSALQADQAELNALVMAEQAHMLYSQLIVSVTGTMAGAGLLVATLAKVVEPLTLWSWFMLMCANQGWRLFLGVRFRRSGLDRMSVDRALAVWAIGSGISGVLWGSGYLLMSPADSPLHLAIMTILIFGVAAGATPLIASHVPSFYAFILPALLPIVARNALEADKLHIILAFVCLVVTLGILSFGRKYNQLLTESLRSRLQNEALAVQLAAQNRELEQARNTAEMASRAKTRFFAAASHDLRQPLHAMGLFAAALADRAHDPEIRHLVGNINASVDALESLFNELLDISKIDAGAIRPRNEPLPLRPLLDRLRTDFAAEASVKGLQLRVRPSDAIVCSDPLLLERVLRNLIDNAIRYTRSGGILVGVRRRADNWRIEVRDTGIGIAPDQIGRVFDEFYQIGNAERDRRRGLGLSIVRRLADLLGHPLTLRSRLDRGTVFALELPALCANHLAERVGDPLPALTGFYGRLIVIVDDEESVRESMHSLLTGWGAEVILCGGVADKVLSIARLQRRPDIVIADYRLSGGTTGIDAIRGVRARFGGQVPAVIVTGSTTAQIAGEAQALGCPLLLKPVMPAKLRSLLNAMLQE
ncbi:MAG: hybrid sensor histidine kinase/response regulator [Betaproteobacteria bacterium]|nr:hybrid sensor histidine kinase/response regulator [Betaproteobacteria bacterium]